MVQIWDRSNLKLNFSFFYHFGTFSTFSTGFACSLHVEKYMVVILAFLSFFSVYFELILRLEAMRKALMSGEKKYVYSYHIGFGLECSLGGSGR